MADIPNEQAENNMAAKDQDNQVKDDAIMKQKEAIEAAIKQAYKLIGDLEEVKVLESEFSNDETFLKNAKALQVSRTNIVQ